MMVDFVWSVLRELMACLVRYGDVSRRSRCIVVAIFFVHCLATAMIGLNGTVSIAARF